MYKKNVNSAVTQPGLPFLMRTAPSGSLTFATPIAEGNVLGLLCLQPLLHQHLLLNYNCNFSLYLFFVLPLWQKSPAVRRVGQTEAARDMKDLIMICKGLRHREGHGRDEGETSVSTLCFYCIKGVGVGVDAE